MYDLSNVDLNKLVRDVYDNSYPVGMGFLHYDPTPLTEAEAEQLIKRDRNYVISMDYVRGRQCKFNVRKDEHDRLVVSYWGDHSSIAFEELMERNGGILIEEVEG